MNDNITFQIIECTNKLCGFRFPLEIGKSDINLCPKCGSPSVLAGNPFSRHEVGKGDISPRTTEIIVLLDNLRSLYNVGSIFRTAEAAGIKKIYLCGMTPTPHNARFSKTSLGSEQTVPWQYFNNGLLAAKALQEQGDALWAVEGGDKATSLYETEVSAENRRIVLIFGNEVSGVDPDILALCEHVLYIPMRGKKESLNVTVAFGISVYHLRYS